jgi:hypothetical protein
MVQQCNLRTGDGHLTSKMRDELGFGASRKFSLVSYNIEFSSSNED